MSNPRECSSGKFESRSKSPLTSYHHVCLPLSFFNLHLVKSVDVITFVFSDSAAIACYAHLLRMRVIVNDAAPRRGTWSDFPIGHTMYQGCSPTPTYCYVMWPDGLRFAYVACFTRDISSHIPIACKLLNSTDIILTQFMRHKTPL